MLRIVDSDMVNNSPAIAAAVASWARIIMYPVLTNSYYSDTDSVFLQSPLNSSMLGKGLGKFKQEYGGLIKKAIFPGPKLYILDTIGGNVTKAKGYSGKLSMSDYSELYRGGYVKVQNSRWRRQLESERVTILNQDDYTIGADFDKRNKLYSKGKWVDTSPIFVNNYCEAVPMDIIPYTYKKYVATVKGAHMAIVPYVDSHNTTKAIIFYIRPITTLIRYTPACLWLTQWEYIQIRNTVFLILITQFNDLIYIINDLFRETKDLRNLPDNVIIFKQIRLYSKLSVPMSYIYCDFYFILFKAIHDKSSFTKDIKDKYLNIIANILALDHNISYILRDLLRIKSEMIAPGPKIRGRTWDGNKYYSPILTWY